MEGLLFPVSVMCLLILLLIFLLKKLNQPYPVAYILAGFLLDSGVTGIFTCLEGNGAGPRLAGIHRCLYLPGVRLAGRRSGSIGPVGSFAAGIYIGRTNAFHWLGDVLKPFKVFFVALFFISLGLMLDGNYIRHHWAIIFLMVLAVMVINSVLSAFVFRLLGYHFSDSLYGKTYSLRYGNGAYWLVR